MMLSRILIFLFFSGVVLAETAEQWKSRTIYQLLTDRFARTDGSTNGCGNISNYCGGSYRGLINHLDYIQGMGFDAIWISPIIDNYGGGYHGYWGRDIYTLNSHFGSESDLVELITECHKRGIWVMVDVVANHMGNTDKNYSSNKLFTDAANYHDYCIISDHDFQNHVQNNI